MTQYYVDQNGTYLGGFDGAEPPAGGIEVPTAPAHASQVYANGAWAWPSKYATVAEAVAGRKADLAALRYEKETAGITLAGASIRTDRESQALITGAWCRAQQNPNVLIDWKGENGWTQIDAATINAIAAAVGDHVQACFSKERMHSDALDALGANPETTVSDIEAYDISIGWPA